MLRLQLSRFVPHFVRTSGETDLRTFRARLCLTIPKRVSAAQQLSHPQQFANQADDPEREEIDGQFLVACTQTPTLFLPANRPLHDVPTAIGLLVKIRPAWLVLAAGITSCT